MKNEQVTVTQLKEQLSALQAQIETLEKKGAGGNQESPWALVETGEVGYFVPGSLSGHGSSTRIARGSQDLNAFKEQSTAQGFANAFHVMIALRQCEGAGQFDKDEWGFVVDEYGSADLWRNGNTPHFTLFPPFPSAGLAKAAADKVGRDKIMAAYKFLATGQ